LRSPDVYPFGADGGEEGTEEGRVRIVADLISSMTEQQMIMTHRKLTDIELGSITDLI
jgi:dGTP triphosphohydrolase